MALSGSSSAHKLVNGVASGHGAKLVFILSGLLTIRVLALAFNGTDLFFDEAQYWSWSRALDFGYFSKPPIIAWLIRAGTETCGTSPFCLRLASPIVHSATAVLIYLIARRLYDPKVGFWSALVFATLPGVSLSAGLISTDVPLLFFWAAALLGFVVFLDERSWRAAIALGLAIGLGLLAKYAMLYFVASAVLYLIVTPARRNVLTDRRVFAALAIAALVIAPNIWWNIENGGVTFSHTAANAKFGGSHFRISKMLEFFATQFGVFGPILFGALVAIAWRFFRRGLAENDRLLFYFSVPVVILVMLLAFYSRAHANWAAVAYVGATILVTAVMIRKGARRWMGGSLALHTALVLAIAGANLAAGHFVLPGGSDPYRRVLGWRGLASEVGRELQRARSAGHPYGAVLTDRRDMAAELLYYLRARKVAIVSWRESDAVPHDHFELTIPYIPGTPVAASGRLEPLLLVHPNQHVGHITTRFETARLVTKKVVPAGLHARRTVYLYSLQGLR